MKLFSHSFPQMTTKATPQHIHSYSISHGPVLHKIYSTCCEWLAALQPSPPFTQIPSTHPQPHSGAVSCVLSACMYDWDSVVTTSGNRDSGLSAGEPSGEDYVLGWKSILLFVFFESRNKRESKGKHDCQPYVFWEGLGVRVVKMHRVNV